MSSGKQHAALFDLDGVPVDSRAAITRCRYDGRLGNPRHACEAGIEPPTGRRHIQAACLCGPLLGALGLSDSFEAIAAPDLNAHNEDKAATIRGALSLLKMERAVMVGDRSFDIIGAHACSIPAIGVSWGIGSAEELATSGADAVVDSPSQLPNVVSDMLVGVAHSPCEVGRSGVAPSQVGRG